jgi:hypothetical protein
VKRQDQYPEFGHKQGENQKPAEKCIRNKDKVTLRKNNQNGFVS